MDINVEIVKTMRQGVGMWYVSFYKWQGCECSKKLHSALIIQENEPTKEDVLNQIQKDNENRNRR